MLAQSYNWPGGKETEYNLTTTNTHTHTQTCTHRDMHTHTQLLCWIPNRLLLPVNSFLGPVSMRQWHIWFSSMPLPPSLVQVSQPSTTTYPPTHPAHITNTNSLFHLIFSQSLSLTLSPSLPSLLPLRLDNIQNCPLVWLNEGVYESTEILSS